MTDAVATFRRMGEDDAVGVAQLNRVKPLNSLLLETIDALSEELFAWLEDDSIKCIVLDSASDRAFCAGADITALYHSIVESEPGTNHYARSFFTNEYRLNYALHTATKPIVVWGNGIVMGGGLGLLGGCSHRIGTPSTKIAMPEITIGLFPDAGGTKFLSSLPDHLGLFAGMTGCQLGAADALQLGLLDYLMAAEAKDDLFAGLASHVWSDTALANGQWLDDFLQGLTGVSAPEPQCLQWRDEIAGLMAAALTADAAHGAAGFFEVFEIGLDSLPDSDWLAGAVATYRAGSPTTARVFLEQMKRAEGMSLPEMFQMELAIAFACIRHPDFPEGVRALLVDKDKNPQWQFSRAADVPDDHVEAHFQSDWEGAHPLANL